MSTIIGFNLSAFTHKHVTNDPLYKVRVEFSWSSMTLGGTGNDPEFLNLNCMPPGTSSTWTNDIEDITGDNTANPDMFQSGNNHPNVSASADGSIGWSHMYYNIENLPEYATERTYRITWGTNSGNLWAPPLGTTKEITVMVHGKVDFRDEDDYLQPPPTDEAPGLVRYFDEPPITAEYMANATGTSVGGTVWKIKHKFIGCHINTPGAPQLTNNNPSTNFLLFSHHNSHTFNGGTADNPKRTPRLVFYSEEITDDKNSFVDHKHNPNAMASYQAGYTGGGTSPTTYGAGDHSVQIGSTIHPITRYESQWVQEDAGTLDDDFYHSYHKAPVGSVADTHIKQIIFLESWPGSGFPTAFRSSTAGNDDYQDMLVKMQNSGTTVGIDHYNLPVFGFSNLTWHASGYNPCVGTTLAFSSQGVNPETSYQANDGDAWVAVTGGSTPYTYSWTQGAGTSGTILGTGLSLNNLAPGTYNCEVTDAVGCTINTNKTVDAAVAGCIFQTELQDTAVSGSCGEVNLQGSILNMVTGGEYLWAYTNPSGTDVLTGDETNTITSVNNIDSTTDYGLWTFTVTANGGAFGSTVCSVSSTVAIVQTVSPSLTMSSTNATSYGGSDGTATASVTGGTSPYTYLWSNGGTTFQITNLSAGTYSVEIQDANGCKSDKTVTVTEPKQVFPGVTGLDVCFNLYTNKFHFTDNQNYNALGVFLPYKIAITVKLINNSSTLHTGNLASPDIFIDSDMASSRTYDATTKYGTNTSLATFSGTLKNDIYEITFDWNFQGTTSVDATHTIQLNGLSIKTFDALSIDSSMSHNCNDDIVNSIDSTNYSINGIPYTFTRAHKLYGPTGYSLPSPVLSSSASALNYTGLEIGFWNNSIITDITWDYPGTSIYQEYCIIDKITGSEQEEVDCYVDPCVALSQCIEKIRSKLHIAECNCDENDIKKYRHILKRVGHLLAMFNITNSCSGIVTDYMLLYDVINLTDCGCDCDCPGGCQGTNA
jgi:hypothetical protein